MCISNSQTTKPARIVWGLGESDRTESESLCVYTANPAATIAHADRAPARQTIGRASGGGPRSASGCVVTRTGGAGVAGARQCTD